MTASLFRVGVTRSRFILSVYVKKCLPVRTFDILSSQIFVCPCLSVDHLTRINFHMSSVTFKRRKTAEERKAPNIIRYTPKTTPKSGKLIEIWKNMTVGELANVLEKDVDHVFEAMEFVDNSAGYTSEDSIIDQIQVIKDVVKRSGMRFVIVSAPGTEEIVQKNKDVVRRPAPDPAVLVKRPPVVTVMGHVDHGKTTLLDALRNTSVVETEFGGITQHIGAFSVKLQTGESITFLDTPGHAAFSAMRARGANVTDLVVLVVAADDGVMEQTVESIRMAKQSGVPILVAINKIDKREADIERTKNMLLEHGIQLEDFAGDVQAVPVSALKGTNLDILSEAIVLQSEIMNLKGDPKGLMEGVVIESKTDSLRGKLSTAIVQRGTLRNGCVLVAGTAWAKVRAMFGDSGKTIKEAPPSTPVEILGWKDLPSAGDEILEVESERKAREVVKWRQSQEFATKAEEHHKAAKVKMEEHLKVYKARLEEKRKLGRYKMKPTGPRVKEIKVGDEGPSLNIVVKGDVDGSVEAILDVLETYDSHSLCKLDIVHYGVGNVSENDVELAAAFNAIVYTFNVQVPKNIEVLANTKKVPIHPHKVIYHLVDDLKKEIGSRLPMKDEEVIVGEANVLQEFIITEGKKKVPVAGSRCTKGMLQKSTNIRVIRRSDTIYDGKLQSLRHMKNEVDSIKKDVECGVMLDNSEVRFQPGDSLVCYKVNSVSQETDWNPGF